MSGGHLRKQLKKFMCVRAEVDRVDQVPAGMRKALVEEWVAMKKAEIDARPTHEEKLLKRRLKRAKRILLG